LDIYRWTLHTINLWDHVVDDIHFIPPVHYFLLLLVVVLLIIIASSLYESTRKYKILVVASIFGAISELAMLSIPRTQHTRVISVPVCGM
jgi:hypothetical protein